MKTNGRLPLLPLLLWMLVIPSHPVFSEEKDNGNISRPVPASPMHPLKKGLEFLEDLPLTDEQKSVILTVFEKESARLGKVVAEEPKDLRPDRQRLHRIHGIQQETFFEIRRILTPEQRETVLKRFRERKFETNAVPSDASVSPFDLFVDPLFIEHLRNDPVSETGLRKEWRAIFETVEGPPSPSNVLDQAVLDLLTQKSIPPAARCSDGVFVRRVFLDAIGTIPTAEEAADFLDDRNPDKRAALIDALLERPEFVEYWTLKWGDALRVKAEFPINLWPNGAMVYQRWIRDSIRNNKPLDRFSRELLLGSGSNFRSPASNFYRAVRSRDAASIAEAVALFFLGERLENRPKEQRDALAVFFSRVSYKKTAEWKEEIVYWDDTPLEKSDVVFPDGKTGRVAPEQDPREVFADWLIAPENPRFARNLVNRLWFWIFGRGIVHAPDDFRDDNPPSNPVLLDVLVSECVRTNYDFKQLLRLILNSRTYQQSSIPASSDAAAEVFFAHYPARQLDAEVLQDMFRQVLGANIGYASDVPEPYMHIPAWRRTITLADGSVTSPFLETFGRPARDSGLLSERSLHADVSQRLFLVNSTEMMQWIERSGKLRAAVNAAAKTGKGDERRALMIDHLWRAVLSRRPTAKEIERAKTLFTRKGANETVVYQDIVWALLNSKEFLCRH